MEEMLIPQSEQHRQQLNQRDHTKSQNISKECSIIGFNAWYQPCSFTPITAPKGIYLIQFLKYSIISKIPLKLNKECKQSIDCNSYHFFYRESHSKNGLWGPLQLCHIHLPQLLLKYRYLN